MRNVRERQSGGKGAETRANCIHRQWDERDRRGTGGYNKQGSRKPRNAMAKKADTEDCECAYCQAHRFNWPRAAHKTGKP